MDSETRALFESRLLTLAQARVRERRLADATHTGSAKNPFCGDEIAVDLRLNSDGGLEALGYEAKACSLCVASAELLSRWLEDMQASAGSVAGSVAPETLHALAQSVDLALKGEKEPAGFEALATVRPFRARHKCVTLPFDAVTKALKDQHS